MPDVFYAMKREQSDNKNLSDESILQQRINKIQNKSKSSTNNEQEYYSTDSTESDTAEMIEKRRKELEKKKLTSSQKFWKRFFSTWSMIAGFFIIVYIGHTALCIFVAVLQAMGFREIAALGSKPRKEKQLPGFYLLHWHFFLTSIFFIYGQLLTSHLLFLNNNNIFGTIGLFIIRHHNFLTFTLIIIGLISFVLSLKAGYYKYQFKQLGWCMAIIIIVVVQSTFVMKNIMDGIIWFIIPAISIITNDVMAYMCGRSFGKKFIKSSLIKLSPNKTWEGAIGACFFTILFTFGFCDFFINYQFFVCPKYGFGLRYPSCEIDQIFNKNINIYNLFYISPFHIHAMIFAAYASLIGPFGGFFASGFKRAFKLKDFSNAVGFGHGGISDRMDCQILMCVFVYVYRQSFIINYYINHNGHNTDFNNMVQSLHSLSHDEQLKLYDTLNTILNNN